MQNSQQLNDELKKRLERATRATLGLRNRKQHKMVVSYTHDEDVNVDDNNDYNNVANNDSINGDNNTVSSSTTSSTGSPAQNAQNAKNKPKENLGWLEWAKKQCLSNFTESEIGIIKQPLALMLKLQLLNSVLKLLPVVAAAPITNYTIIDGSTDCSTFSFVQQPIFDCQRFSIWSNGLQILTGRLHRGYGKWDEDPDYTGSSGVAGMPDGVCKSVFDACNSYPKMLARVKTLLSHENATDFLTSNFNEDDFSENGACRDHLAVTCIAGNFLYGLNKEGCIQFIGCDPRVSGNTLTFQCFDAVTKELKEQEGLRTLGKIGIGFGVAIPALYILHRLHKRYKANKEQEAKAAKAAEEVRRAAAIRKAQMEERESLYRNMLSGATTMIIASRESNDERNPIPDELTIKILEYVTKDQALSTWAMLHANRIQGYGNQASESGSPKSRKSPSHRAQPSPKSLSPTVIIEMQPTMNRQVHKEQTTLEEGTEEAGIENDFVDPVLFLGTQVQEARIQGDRIQGSQRQGTQNQGTEIQDQGTEIQGSQVQETEIQKSRTSQSHTAPTAHTQHTVETVINIHPTSPSDSCNSDDEVREKRRAANS